MIINLQELIVAFGGTVVVSGAVSAFVSKLISDVYLENRKAALAQNLELLKSELGREAERFKSELSSQAEARKLQIKKQELLFNKEIDATAAFIKLRRAIAPQFSHPDMDWDDACREVAAKFYLHEEAIKDFVVFHGAIIEPSIKKAIEACETKASTFKFDGQEIEYELNYQATNEAKTFLKELELIEQSMIDVLRK